MVEKWEEDLTKEDFVNLFNKHGRVGVARILTQTAKASHPYHAFETTVGRELLIDVARICNTKLEKIIKEEASSEELAEYRVARELLTKWGSKIARYLKLIGEWKGEEIEDAGRK